MTTAILTPFLFDGETLVRVIDIGGDPWFVATDVAAVLGYRDAENAIRILDYDEKGTHNVCTPGGDQTHSIVSESGLYALIFKSRRDGARRFRKWVTAEVLPAIRKTGGYAAGAVVRAETARLRAVAQTHRTWGVQAARQMWLMLGLPVVPAMADPSIQPDLWDRTPGGENTAFSGGTAGRA